MIKTCYTSNKKEMITLLSETAEANPLVVFEDDGFLPKGITSPYRYYVDGCVFAQKEEAPLLADFIAVPDLWEICMNYTHGEIWDDGIQRGQIEFALPIEEHNVKSVSWIENGDHVYKKDFYDKFGKLYFIELLGADQTVNVRIFLSGDKPVVIEQPKFDMYTLLLDGKEEKVFGSKKEFCNYFMETSFPREAEVFSKTPSGEILILTNSDNIENISVLVEKLPEFHFHIGAKTLMSEKLHDLKRYGNVSLYEGISEKQRNALLESCSYYLDINHGREICNSVYEAYRHGLLNIGFSNTIHDRKSILAECIFLPQNAEEMIAMVEELHRNPDRYTKMVVNQFERRGM